MAAIEVQYKQQNLERELQHQFLVKQALGQVENPLACFGGWLIRQGTRLQENYNLDEQPTLLPVQSAVNDC
jgi:hypothetical protein